jgi:dipeptidase E
MMSNLKPIYLLAGGRAKTRKTPDPLIQAVFRETGKSSPIIAYVGTASEDDKTFFRYVAKILREAGASKVDHALITPPKADLKKARDILQAADIVFISGGDVEIGMKMLKEKNMTDFLFQLYKQGMLFFGVSAGSIMLAKEWVRWKDPNDDSTAELFPCMGFTPIICDTHAEDENWEGLKMALKLDKDSLKGYGIATGTGIRVYPDGNIEALGGAIYQYVKHGAKVDKDSDILPHNTTHLLV